MDPINLLVWVIVLIVLIVVVFWLLNHFMFIAPLGFDHAMVSQMLSPSYLARP